MAKPTTVQADTMMAMRFQTRSRVRCSVRNSVSSGSSKRRKRKPFASRRAASEVLGDEFFVSAIRPSLRGSLKDETALYVFGRRGASRATHQPWIWAVSVRVRLAGVFTRVRQTSSGLHACLRTGVATSRGLAVRFRLRSLPLYRQLEQVLLGLILGFHFIP